MGSQDRVVVYGVNIPPGDVERVPVYSAPIPGDRAPQQPGGRIALSMTDVEIEELVERVLERVLRKFHGGPSGK